MIQPKLNGLIKISKCTIAKRNQIVLVPLSDTVCSSSLLTLLFIYPREMAANVPWVSTALVAICAWEVSAEGGPVSLGSANRVSTLCAWEKVFHL